MARMKMKRIQESFQESLINNDVKTAFLLLILVWTIPSVDGLLRLYKKELPSFHELQRELCEADCCIGNGKGY